MKQILLVDLGQTIVGDGVTDDSGTINAAIASIRQAHLSANGYDFGCCLRFPPAFIMLSSSINLTSLRGINTVIEGNGAVLIGECAGQPVIDGVDSRWLTIRDLVVMGDQIKTPTIGLQMGMATTANADDHLLENVKICGWFTLACLYNRAGETSGFHHVFAWNSQPNSYCLIQDGLNHFGLTSQFVACTLPVDTDLSFNENEFINCDFRHGAAGVPLWIGDTSRHQFTRCYAATDGDAAVVLFSAGNGHRLLHMDCHFETAKLGSVFRLSGAPNIDLRGLTLIEHQCFANKAVFTCDPNIVKVVLENAQLVITGFNNAGCKMFAQPAIWRISGNYATSWGNNWNATDFRGIITNGTDMKMIGVPVRMLSGGTAVRPVLSPADVGTQFFDTHVQKVIIWSGTQWLDAMGDPT
jgi:hypothetical protein